MESPKKQYTILDSELGLERKKRLLHILMALSISVLAVLGGVALFQKHHVLALFDWAAGLLLLGNALFLRRTGNTRKAAWIGLLGLGGLFLFLMVDGGVYFTAFIWIFTYPILTIYLLGGLRGTLLTSFVLALFLAIRLFAPHIIGEGHPYSISFLVRFLASMAVISFVAIYMDLAWREAQQLIQKKNALLEDLSRLDGLTGIYNRRFFDEELERQWSLAQRGADPLSVLMLDVDHFKLYNDHYGHQAGDEALVAVARLLCSQASRKIDIAARYGGEEFVVILPGTGFGGAINVARKILRKLEAMNVEHKKGIGKKLTASIGIACFDENHRYDSAAALIKQADQELYNAKLAGRNGYQPDPGDKAHG